MNIASPANIFLAEWRAMLAARRRRIASLLIVSLLLSGIVFGSLLAEAAAPLLVAFYIG